MLDATIVYVDPNRRAYFVAEMPDWGYMAYTQPVDGSKAPRKLIAKYIQSEGYATKEAAQKALDLYLANHNNGSGIYGWETLVNGKVVSRDDYYAMCRGELAVPAPTDEVRLVTLRDIEHQIAHHLRGAYCEMLEVGRCLNEAKEAELVPHGQWEDWVRRNTNMSERQAQKLMQAARSVSVDSALARLPISKIQAILSLPEPEREEMAERVADEDISLRKLREEIDAIKRHAEKRENALTAASNRAAVQLREKAATISGMQEERERLLAQLREAKKGDGVGVSPETQARIDELEAQVVELEEFAGEQAAQREAAQREMLALKSQQGSGSGSATGFTTAALEAAVRTFIGSVGVVPHMGQTLAKAASADRQVYTQCIDMVATWVDGARRALAVEFVEM